MAKKKKIISRMDTIAQGKTVFFTGRPCRQGHIVQRYTSTGHCLECLRLHALRIKEAVKAGRESAGAI